ncbi:hypothetical protein JCM14469_28310 [Desulfatiferula olefinivorans]
MKKAQLKKRWLTALMTALLTAAIPLSASAAKTVNTADAPLPTSVKVDINTADAAMLCTLPGIGPDIAERIVAYRAEHGPFTSADQLEQVKGVGQKKLARISGLVTAGPAK